MFRISLLRILLIGLRSSLVLLAVVLSTLSLPGGPLPALGLISVVPFVLALHGAPPIASAAYAYACAFLGWLLATSGLATAFSAYVQGPALSGIIAIVAACAMLAVPYGLFGLIYGRFRWLPFHAAACLTLIVSWFPTPLPIDSTHALYTFPELIQILDLGGQPLLLFVFYLFTWNFAQLIQSFRERRSPRPALAVLLTIAILVPAYGSVRIRQFRDLEATRPMNMAVIQPDIPLGGDSNPHSSDALNPFHTLVDMSAEVLAHHTNVDLVVWPETPLRMTCQDEHGTRSQFADLLARFGVPLLINCVQPALDGGDYNAQLLLTPHGQDTPYYKLKLFPFAEYLPGESHFPALRQVFPSISHYVPATDPVVFQIGSHPGIFVAICYEILFPGHIRQFINRGGEILITSANDAWFGDSRIPDFQVAESVFQAVQYRVPVVRVSNSGNSLAITASGEIIPGSRTPPYTRTAAAYTIHVPRARSTYSYIGDTFLYALGVVFVLTLARARSAFKPPAGR
jgi:apolipoprotein N-acyltransferase